MEERIFPSPVSDHQSSANEEVSQGKKSESSGAESLTELSMFIEKLNRIASEMKENKKLMDTPEIQKAVDSLETDLQRAKVIRSPNTFHSSPIKSVEDVIENLGRSLGLVLFASRDMIIDNRGEIEALRKEMMGARFNISSGRESDFTNEIDTEEEIEEVVEEEIMEEIVEEDKISWDVDDIVLQLRNGDDDSELKYAVSRLNVLINDNAITNERVDDESIISILFSRLRSKSASNRTVIIHTLRRLIAMNEENKEKMAESVYLITLVKSLTQEIEEQREAVGLLSKLSEISEVRRKIGRIQGSIIILVSIFNGDDQVASHDAGRILKALSSNTQYALNMAEAGYFKPLVQYLKEVSRMELTDYRRASLGEEGAIEPLMHMFNKGNLEAKLSALSALQNLSSSKENIQRLIDSGIVIALIQLLFSVTSVLMTLREPASAILARIAQSASILVKHDIAQQMLSLLNLSSPVIQCHLLDALNSIATHPKASKVRKKMRQSGALKLLFPFLSETNTPIKTGALQLIYTLSKDRPDELKEQLDVMYISTIINIISSSTSESEKAAAIGILSNLPVSDRKTTDILRNANILLILVSIINSSTAALTSTTAWLDESISALLIRFTVPSDKRLQHLSAEQGVIQVLVKLLSSCSMIAKSNAATCLAQLSQNSTALSNSKKSRWFCVCPSSDSFCKVHEANCTVKSTFCLVKAGAVSPLIQILEQNEREADEAVLDCLSTLLQDEIWENGSNYIEQMSGVQAIIKVLQSGNLKAQEKAMSVLEKIFRVEAHRGKYGESAEVVLIDLAQCGNPILKPSVAKLLAQLELLLYQSSYF